MVRISVVLVNHWFGNCTDNCIAFFSADKTIKLGLGDFIFYSVLVGRAAMFDFSTFVATFVCIVVVRGVGHFALLMGSLV